MPAGPERAASDTPPSPSDTGWCTSPQHHHYKEEEAINDGDYDQRVLHSHSDFTTVMGSFQLMIHERTVDCAVCLKLLFESF